MGGRRGEREDLLQGLRGGDRRPWLEAVCFEVVRCPESFLTQLALTVSCFYSNFSCIHVSHSHIVFAMQGGSVAEWLACWTQAQNGLGLNCSHDAVGLLGS